MVLQLSMIDTAVGYASQAFAREYHAPNITDELNRNAWQGNVTGGLHFALAFPIGIEKYSRKDLIPDLYWYIKGYLQEERFPKMGLRDIVKSAFSSAPVRELVRAHEAYQKGLAERKKVLAETGEAAIDLEATLKHDKRKSYNFTSAFSSSSQSR